jgi:hypothetical protein
MPRPSAAGHRRHLALWATSEPVTRPQEQLLLQCLLAISQRVPCHQGSGFSRAPCPLQQPSGALGRAAKTHLLLCPHMPVHHNHPNTCTCSPRASCPQAPPTCCIPMTQPRFQAGAGRGGNRARQGVKGEHTPAGGSRHLFFRNTCVGWSAHHTHGGCCACPATQNTPCGAKRPQSAHPPHPRHTSTPQAYTPPGRCRWWW